MGIMALCDSVRTHTVMQVHRRMYHVGPICTMERTRIIRRRCLRARRVSEVRRSQTRMTTWCMK